MSTARRRTPLGQGVLATKCKIIAGSSNPALAEALSRTTGIPVAETTLGKFSGGETRFDPSCKESESVRGKTVIIVQTGGCTDVNDHIMEIMFMADAYRRSGCGDIILVVPCFPYARQDKKDKPRQPISSSVVINMLKEYVSHVITMELHSPQLQAVFPPGVDVDNLPMKPLVYERFRSEIAGNYANIVFVAPDYGALKRVSGYAQMFHTDKSLPEIPCTSMDKRRSHEKANTIESMELTNKIDMRGKTAYIFDDMADTIGTACTAAKSLKEDWGTSRVIVVVCHGILSGPALERLDQPHIDQMVVCNGIPVPGHPKISCIDVSQFLAGVISAVLTGESVSALLDVVVGR
jgi:ribose-phosphate pyrophosphokinase